MVFSEFAHKLSSVLRSGDNTVAFTKTLLESILNEDGQSVLEEYKESSYKGFYNGNTKITRLAKKINAFVEPMNFVEYIQGYPDAVVSNICDQFRSEIPDIDPFNAGDKLAELFVKIITEAASDSERDYQKYVVIDSGAFITPPVLTGELVVLPEKEIPGLSVTVKQADPFRDYIDKAVDHYSEKKTLLYAESPRPFYSMYVCNDLLLHKFQLPGFKGDRSSLYRTDITAASLEKESEYNIIQGTGGIGKSMLMTHLFLSSAKEYVAGGRLPVLVLLKDYKEEYPDLVTFIHKAITDFAPDIGCEKLVEKLKNGQVIVLLDGLDEIRSQLKESFDSNLESFIKCYPGNSVFLTSRPIDDFVSYSKFTVYDIVPLRKEQALELINKLEFWDEEKKKAFISDLDMRLYHSHKQFASNPLLLTIMLMTYSSYGEIPEKMHVFYAEAYRTMARLHDRTKGSYKRPLYTGLTPEEFAVYFSQFCARTLVKELLEFTADLFSQFMSKVIQDIGKDVDSLKPMDFLRDLTDNLCIMYCEGEKYYFIHRSFQEYFASMYFVNNEDILPKVGFDFDERGGLFSRRVLEMMYEMEPERVERLVFLPYLDRMFLECGACKKGRYWGFLLKQYPIIYYNEGDVYDPEVTTPESLVYEIILNKKELAQYDKLDDFGWIGNYSNCSHTDWVWAYEDYLKDEAFTGEKNRVTETTEAELALVRKDDLPLDYKLCFGEPDFAGSTYEIDVEAVLDDLDYYESLNIVDDLANPKFPLHIEYKKVLDYCLKLKERAEKKKKSTSLFDD